MPSKNLPSPTIRFFFFLLIILGLWLLGKFFNIDVLQYQALLKEYPLWLSASLFILLYVVVTFLVWFGTIDIFRISAAILFGGVVSTVIVWVAELINAFMLFHLSRKLGRDYVVEKFRLKAKYIEQAKERPSAFGVFVLRFNPLVPFRIMDLAYGLSKLRFKTYFKGIVFSSLVRIFWLQSIIAIVGQTAFKNPSLLIASLPEHPFILIYSAVYFLSVLILSVVAVIFYSQSSASR